MTRLPAHGQSSRRCIRGTGRRRASKFTCSATGTTFFALHPLADQAKGCTSLHVGRRPDSRSKRHRRPTYGGPFEVNGRCHPPGRMLGAVSFHNSSKRTTIMIRISIGNQDRQYSSISDVEERWIAQQLRRRGNGEPCVSIELTGADCNMRLSSGACSGGGGGGPQPNRKERRIFELWNDRAVDPGEVISFLKQSRRLV